MTNKPIDNVWPTTSDAHKVSLSRTLLAMTKNAVFFATKDFQIIFGNQEFEKRFNIKKNANTFIELDDLYPEIANERQLANAKAVIESMGYWTGDMTSKTAEDKLLIEELTISAVENFSQLKEHEPCYVGLICNVSNERYALEQLAWNKNHDELTGLPNRTLFISAVNTVLKRSNIENATIALITADMDNFKHFNNDYGRETGDKILKAIAKKIATQIDPGNIIARTSGDEFSAMVSMETNSDVEKTIQYIENIFLTPVTVNGQSFSAHASLGVSLWPRDGSNAQELLASADLALQVSKDKTSNKITLYSRDITASKRGKASLEADLRQAIDTNLLSVHYQPVVKISTGQIDSVEALVRWNDPIRGQVQPEGFIPLAEQTGLIIKLGELVMQSACNQSQRWSNSGDQSIKVSVNVSPIQLSKSDFPNKIADMLIGSGLPPEKLIIEITESIMLEKIENASQILARLKNLGITISVDDFGTRYASLSYIKNLPIDIIKMDKEFISDIDKSGVALEIVEGIVKIAHNMGMLVTAEGVETAEQFYLLKNMGCDHAQGFLFSRALPPDELEGRYLQTQGSSSFFNFKFLH